MRLSDFTQAKLIAHWMPWHGTKSHVPLLYCMPDGTTKFYDSSDMAICNDQCSKMVAMGISGINVDYYGPDATSSLAAIRMLRACEASGLAFSLCIDQGAIPAGVDPTTEYSRILKFASEVFFNSSSYLQDGGRYIVSFFGEPAGVNWTKVRQSISNKLAFLFQANFTHAEADGAFGWVNPVAGQPGNINQASVASYNQMAAANPTKISMSPIYPGFDDTLASWGKGRYMTRGLDRTLKSTLSWIPLGAKYALIATWNDHEEGTGLETGISIS